MITFFHSKSKLIHLVVTLLFSLSFSSCTDVFVGEYANPNEVEIVDEYWNETDARKTSEVLINSMLSKAWLKMYTSQHKGKRPIVLVDDIENRTNEHIDTKALGEAIRNEMINSGQLRFVNAEGRSRILKEMKYQNDSGMVDPTKAQSLGKQIGAQFMLSGAISAKPHEKDGLMTITYQTVLQLTSFETAEIVWSEKYNIKKRFKRSSSRF